MEEFNHALFVSMNAPEHPSTLLVAIATCCMGADLSRRAFSARHAGRGFSRLAERLVCISCGALVFARNLQTCPSS